MFSCSTALDSASPTLSALSYRRLSWRWRCIIREDSACWRSRVRLASLRALSIRFYLCTSAAWPCCCCQNSNCSWRSIVRIPGKDVLASSTLQLLDDFDHLANLSCPASQFCKAFRLDVSDLWRVYGKVTQCTVYMRARAANMSTKYISSYRHVETVILSPKTFQNSTTTLEDF